MADASEPVTEGLPTSLPEPAAAPQTATTATQTDPPPKKKSTPNQRAALAAARDRYNAGRTHLKMEKMRLKLLGYGVTTLAPQAPPPPPAVYPAYHEAPPPPPQKYVRYC